MEKNELHLLIGHLTAAGASHVFLLAECADDARWKGEDLWVEHDDAALPFPSVGVIFPATSGGGLIGLTLIRGERSRMFLDVGEASLNVTERTKLIRYAGSSLVGLLYSRRVAIKPVTYAEKLKKSRQKKGKAPRYDYHIVTIEEPMQYERTRNRGHHESPRMHWRRGHVRRLPTGLTTPVRPTLVGDISKGVVSKDYLVP